MSSSSRWLAASIAAVLTGLPVRAAEPRVLAPDGAWTWYNDPRALYHNGLLYFGYVRSNDARSVLSAYDPRTGVATVQWASGWTQRDDHDNPALLPLRDGRLLALYARHGTTKSFEYRWSTTTNPASAADWTAEQVFTNTSASVTYCNPFQLADEGGRVYQFTRNLNFNPTFVWSDDAGTNWSTPQLLIRTGGGGVRPYMKYASDRTNRVDFLYTDGHPRDVTNSLYHLYYEGGALRQTDGTFLKALADAPLLHDSGERGAVIYAYSTAETNDPNAHIPGGRAWCWEIAHPPGGEPVCVFTVQRDQVMGANWYDDRIYYYYARWTGAGWQKRFIAHAGRPLYQNEDDYAGGIALDPHDPAVVYLSSNAADPFDLSQTTNVPLRTDARYEIWRGVTADGGLTFAWEPVTTNSAKDNLRPYVPQGRPGNRSLVWFRGVYTTYTSFRTEVVGLLEHPEPPDPPEVAILSPVASAVIVPHPGSRLELAAAVTDDGEPGPLSFNWSTRAGPTNAVFGNASSTHTSARFTAPGAYIVRATADDTLVTVTDEVVVHAGEPNAAPPDPDMALWLKLDENAGATAADSSGRGLDGSVGGAGAWAPDGGARAGALAFNGSNTVVTVPDADALDATAALTFAWWFRMDRYPASVAAGLVCKRIAPTDHNAYTTFMQTDRRINVDLDSNNNRFTSDTLFETGRWYHVAVVFDGTRPAAERATLYVDGAVERIAPESSAAIPNCASDVAVGNVTASAVNWFAGRIDDVRIYRRALAAHEVAALAAWNAAPYVSAGVPPPATNGAPVALDGQAFDDGRGGTWTAQWTVASGPGAVAFGDASLPATSARFSQPGTYVLRLRAADGEAAVFDEMSLAVAADTNTYEGWAFVMFPGETNAAVIGVSADPDRDRQPNLVEFALGLTPSVAEWAPFEGATPGLPRPALVSVTGAVHAALEVRHVKGREGVAYGAEAAGELVSPAWLEAPLTGPPTDHGDGTETRWFVDPLSVSSTSPRFLRLRVERSAE